MPDYQRVVVTRIRQELKAQERSQAWLARQLRMNESQLAHYLAGRRPWPGDLLPRIAGVLDIPVEDLSPPEMTAA